MVNCPLCDAAIDVEEDELDEGDALTCEECGANLTVDGLDPLELSAEDDDDEEDEDFDEFDEEDDEDEDGDDLDDSDGEDNDGWR